MARFTNGSVHYLRRVNTGNYEHKEFAADISWSADEGEAMPSVLAVQEMAAERAVAVVHHRLGLASIAPTIPETVEQLLHGQSLYDQPGYSPPDWAGTKVAFPEMATAVETPAVEPVEAPKRGPGRPRKNPDAVAPPPLTVVSDPLLSPAVVAELSQPLVSEISDRDLLDQVTEWVRAHGGQEAVLPLRNLIRSFDAPQLAMVPQERRVEFLAKLAELTP